MKKKDKELEAAGKAFVFGYAALHAIDFILDKNSPALVSMFLTGDELTKHVIGMYLDERWKRIDKALIEAGKNPPVSGGEQQ